MIEKYFKGFVLHELKYGEKYQWALLNIYDTRAEGFRDLTYNWNLIYSVVSYVSVSIYTVGVGFSLHFLSADLLFVLSPNVLHFSPEI